MKKFKMFTATIIMAAFTTVGFSQTTADHHKALTSHREKAKKHADAIANGTSKTKAEDLKKYGRGN